MFKDVLKVIAALIPVAQALLKDIKKARETGDEEKVKEKIRNLNTDVVRRAILGEL